MKKISNLLFSAVVLLLALGASSCTDSKTKELLSVVGDDAYVVAVVNTVDVLKSLDAGFENGQVTLPASLKKIAGSGVKEISKVRGIDFERVLFASYDGQPSEMCAVLIKDGKEVEASLKKFNMKKKKVGDKAVFIEDTDYTGGAVAFCQGNVLIFYTHLWWYDEDDMQKKFEEIFDRATESVEDWKVSAIQGNSSSSVFGLFVSPDSKLDVSAAFAVNFSGSKATFEAKVMNTSGEEIELNKELGLEPAMLGNMTKHISDKDHVAFAFGGVKDMSILDAIEEVNIPGMSNEINRNFRYAPFDAEDFFKALNGGFFVTANLENPAKQPKSLKDMTAAVGLRTVDGRGEKMLKELKSLAKNAGVKVTSEDDGFGVKIPEMGNINIVLDGDCLIAATAEESPNSTMGSENGLAAVLSVNLPSNFFLFKDYGVKFGVKGHAQISDNVLQGEVELTETDKPFLLALVEAADKASR